MERRILAIGLAIAAVLTSTGGALAGAGATQSMEWAIPLGTVMGIAGIGLGSGIGTYKAMSREPVGPVIGGRGEL